MKPLISIILVTKNNAWELRRLLRAMKEQGSWVETIIVDTGSGDDTKHVAKENTVIFLEEKARDARMIGGRRATADVLLFLSPYAILSHAFLKDSLAEFKQRRLETAGTYWQVKSKNPFDHLLLGHMRNAWYFFTHIFFSQASFTCLFTTKQYFERKNGFDKTLVDGVADAFVKKSRQGILRVRPLLLDSAQIAKEGRFVFYWRAFYLFVYRLFFRELKRKELFYPKASEQ